MKKKLNYYNIFMTAMMVVIAGLLLATGIIALQKSMNMKVGVNITPSHEIRIDYGGETIFCNTTKDSAGIKVASGYTLSGNTLTFTQEFISIGETFALTIYNYNTSYLQVSVSGTGASGNTLTIDPYSTTATSGVLNLTIGAGASEAVLSFNLINVYSISHTGSNYTFNGNTTILEGNSYSATFSAPQYYNLPDTLTITMGGETLTSGYTYTKTSDTAATLTINSVIGDIRITCNAVADSINVTIQVYAEDSTTSLTTIVNGTASITYPSTSITISGIRPHSTQGGIAGTAANVSYSMQGFGDDTIFNPTNGSGSGYNWTCVKYDVDENKKNYLKVTINVVWGTYASNITIDIYRTANS